MSKRIDIVSTFYGGIDEDSRLTDRRHGQLEYTTAMHYIRRYAEAGCRILEIGAGTGGIPSRWRRPGTPSPPWSWWRATCPFCGRTTRSSTPSLPSRATRRICPALPTTPLT